MRTTRMELEIILKSLKRTKRLKRIYLAHVCCTLKERLKRRGRLNNDEIVIEECQEILDLYRSYLKRSHLKIVA